MLVQNLQIGRVVVDDDDRRAFLDVVVMATLPVLFVAAFPVAKEANAVDDQQFAAVLLGR